jgi:hypothetical protein
LDRAVWEYFARSFDVSLDGSRFLMVSTAGSQTDELLLVLNLTSDLHSNGARRRRDGWCRRDDARHKLRSMTTAGLPGEELIEAGLRDLAHGTESVESLLVSIAASRLRALGVHVPAPIANPELTLYSRLAAVHGEAAHARYNALLRRLVSYQRAAACAK